MAFKVNQGTQAKPQGKNPRYQQEKDPKHLTLRNPKEMDPQANNQGTKRNPEGPKKQEMPRPSSSPAGE
jgi:hypothetical protein